ncbi:hypothetical protein QQS21_005174 [Conoideocrella luteorostrata]|uniref:Uncharacterized protein n=1 Tax=Conoideocrella luteorostrata TaxID=1105319 RepID=A0AAJ0FU16_9HYPO|nr:hypothetical protein QQS21_005174 [Conoideocrella luteorostrata]
MPYDRDTVVRCMERYYDLLVEMAYIEASDILRPPPTGWTDKQLAMELLAPAGRSETVIDLLKHLPYLRRNRNAGTSNHWQIHEQCRSVSYLHEADFYAEGHPEDADTFFHEQLMPFDGLVTPPGMIALASDCRVDVWVLDVDEGAVYDCSSWLVDDDAPEELPWKKYGHQMEVEEFFDEVYGHVKKLLLIPVPGGDDRWPYIQAGNCTEGRQYKRLLEEHGWPEKLDKESYLESLKVHRRA